jgi:hypothetical protein
VSFIVCIVSFDRGVILCDVCYLFVLSYGKPLPPGKTPFSVNKYYITLHYILQDDFGILEEIRTFICMKNIPDVSFI